MARRARSAAKKPAQPSGWSEFYRVIKRVPRGRVSTYGAIASLAGKPRAARHVGFALAALHGSGHGVPWQRIVAARGKRHGVVTIRDPIGGAIQRELLEGEGVEFDAQGRIELARFGWTPRANRAASKTVTKAASRKRARNPVAPATGARTLGSGAPGLSASRRARTQSAPKPGSTALAQKIALWDALVDAAVAATTPAAAKKAYQRASAMDHAPVDLFAEDDADERAINAMHKRLNARLNERIRALPPASPVAHELCCLRDLINAS